jgi:hypothetical protein
MSFQHKRMERNGELLIIRIIAVFFNYMRGAELVLMSGKLFVYNK